MVFWGVLVVVIVLVVERLNIIARDTFHITACCEPCSTAPAPGRPVRAQDQSLVPWGVSAAVIAPVSREGTLATSPSIARPEGTVTSFSLTSERSEVLAGKQKENYRDCISALKHSSSS